MREPAHAEHFESLAQQAHAARLGMWIFLASETLLFAGLFALYVAYRASYPAEFAEGVQHNARVLGSVNTLVLLCSSYAVASATTAQRFGAKRRAIALLALGAVMGGGFLAIKLSEYASHFREGIHPGGWGHYFVAHPGGGYKVFWTLYFTLTGLHALHVVVGMTLLAWAAWKISREHLPEESEHRVAVATMFWHLVDVFWIFLWPMFYLLNEP